MMNKIEYDNTITGYVTLIGKNLQRFRGGMEKKELASLSGVSRQTILKAENGGGLSLDNLLRLAVALNVHPAELLINADALERKRETLDDYIIRIVDERVKKNR